MNPTTPVLTDEGFLVPKGIAKIRPVVRFTCNGLVHDLDESALVRLSSGEWVRASLLTPKTRLMPSHLLFNPYIPLPMSDHMGPFFAYGFAYGSLKVGEPVSFMGRQYQPLRPRTPAELVAFRSGFQSNLAKYRILHNDLEMVSVLSLCGFLLWSRENNVYGVSNRKASDRPRVGPIERTEGPLLTYAPGEYLLPSVQIKIVETP